MLNQFKSVRLILPTTNIRFWISNILLIILSFSFYNNQCSWFYGVGLGFLGVLNVINHLDQREQLDFSNNIVENVTQGPLAMIIVNDNNDIIYINNLGKTLCENKNIKKLDDFFKIFNEYSIIVKTLELGISSLNYESFFTKDINLGDKIWRISCVLNKKNSTRSIFILDVTEEKEGESLNNTLSNVLSMVEDGIIITNQIGNILFYNIAASNLFKIYLTGKNIKQIEELKNLEINTSSKINYNDKLLKISANYHGKEYIIYKIKQVYFNFNMIFQGAPFGVIILNNNMEIKIYNDFWKYHLPHSVTLEKCIAEEQRYTFLEFVKHVHEKKKTSSISVNIINKDGPFVTVFAQSDKDYTSLFFIDDVQSKEIKTHFMHEQRLYALGEIAGSIAHDFNNIISVILSRCDEILTRNQFNQTNKDYLDLMKIKHSSSRAAGLVRQILNVSRKQELQEQLLDVSEAIFEFISTLGKSLGKNIDIHLQQKKENIYLFIHEVKFEQILINLIMNARDAMPKGGNIYITTDIININKNNFDNGYSVAKGKYLEMSVADSGSGISPSHLQQIFKPFFTTKKEKGTGFGLSTVNNLVKQKGGFIKVMSKPNVGTTFVVYLPIYEKTEVNEKKIIDKSEKKIYDKNIVIVDDEINILEPMSNYLKNKSLNVKSFSCGNEASKAIEESDKLDLLITDIVMPEITGVELFELCRNKFPSAKVIFTSGYDKSQLEDIQSDDVFFLQKPYSSKELYDLVFSVL